MKHRKFFAVIILVLLLCSVFSILTVGKTNECEKCHSTLISHEAKAPTCTEDGNRIYHTCSNPDCDYTTLYDTYGELSNFLPKLGHETEKTSAIPATCTENGKTAGEKCTREGCNYESYTVIPATGHTEVIIGAFSATCTTAGSSGALKCISCGITLKSAEIIPAKGHSEVKLKAVSPGCLTAGKTEGSYCKICGYVFAEQKEIPATGHSFDKGTADGNSVIYICTVCGYRKTIAAESADGDGTTTDITLSLPSFMSVSGLFCRITAGKTVEDTNAVVMNGTETVSASTRIKTGFTIILNNSKFTVAVPGDVNRDGKLTADDARAALRQALGKTKYGQDNLNFCTCDFDGNNEVEIDDARQILRFAIGIYS